MPSTYFVDTVFVQALLDKNDQHHEWAVHILPIVKSANRVWITEAILIEVASALSAVNRTGAALFIRQCFVTNNISVVPLEHGLFLRGLTLYENRPDKRWSLVDCISFIVMEDHKVKHAITTDHHYEQAGFVLVA